MRSYCPSSKNDLIFSFSNGFSTICGTPSLSADILERVITCGSKLYLNHISLVCERKKSDFALSSSRYAEVRSLMLSPFCLSCICSDFSGDMSIIFEIRRFIMYSENGLAINSAAPSLPARSINVLSVSGAIITMTGIFA